MLRLNITDKRQLINIPANSMVLPALEPRAEIVVDAFLEAKPGARNVRQWLRRHLCIPDKKR